jgi:hypothetical protein
MEPTYSNKSLPVSSYAQISGFIRTVFTFAIRIASNSNSQITEDRDPSALCIGL